MEGRRVSRRKPRRNPLYTLFMGLLALSLVLFITVIVLSFKLKGARRDLADAQTKIEQLRGVRVERALAKLLELGLICELGRKQVIGRPILYGTTAAFLRCFGLDSLDDLPQLPAEDPAVRLELEAEAAGQSGKVDSAAEKDSPAENAKP